MLFRLLTVTILGVNTLLFIGCSVKTTTLQESACTITEIEWKLTSKAELTGFQCMQGNDTDTPSLIFMADVQNTTRKPLRYRLSIVLPDLKRAIGHLVPRKGVPPVVMPGDTEKMTLIFENTAGWPKKAEVVLIVLPDQPEIPK